MGLTTEIYQGPHWVVGGVEREHKHSLIKCLEGCPGSKASGPFCPMCGAPRGAKPKTTLAVAPFTPGHLPSQYEDLFVAARDVEMENFESIWLPNKKGLGAWLSSGSYISRDVGAWNDMVVQELEAAKRYYPEVLEYVKSKGASVDIRYGIVVFTT